MKLRGKLAQRYANDGELDTPFQLARQEWDNRQGTTVVQASNWRKAAFVALIGWLATSAGLGAVALRPAAVRMVSVDREGVAVSQVLPVAAGDFKRTDPMVAHYLRAWIIDARRVSSDAGVTKAGWVRAHARTVGTASQEMYDYFKALGGPVERSKKQMVTIEQINIIPVTKATYQADWKEKLWTPYATAPVVTAFRGLHRIDFRAPPVDDPDNAIGFFVAEYHWHQVR